MEGASDSSSSSSSSSEDEKQKEEAASPAVNKSTAAAGGRGGVSWNLDDDDDGEAARQNRQKDMRFPPRLRHVAVRCREWRLWDLLSEVLPIADLRECAWLPFLKVVSSYPAHAVAWWRLAVAIGMPHQCSDVQLLVSEEDAREDRKLKETLRRLQVPVALFRPAMHTAENSRKAAAAVDRPSEGKDPAAPPTANPVAKDDALNPLLTGRNSDTSLPPPTGDDRIVDGRAHVLRRIDRHAHHNEVLKRVFAAAAVYSCDKDEEDGSALGDKPSSVRFPERANVSFRQSSVTPPVGRWERCTWEEAALLAEAGMKKAERHTTEPVERGNTEGTTAAASHDSAPDRFGYHLNTSTSLVSDFAHFVIEKSQSPPQQTAGGTKPTPHTAANVKTSSTPSVKNGASTTINEGAMTMQAAATVGRRPVPPYAREVCFHRLLLRRPLSPLRLPSLRASVRIGHSFDESRTGSAAAVHRLPGVQEERFVLHLESNVFSASNRIDLGGLLRSRVARRVDAEKKQAQVAIRQGGGFGAAAQLVFKLQQDKKHKAGEAAATDASVKVVENDGGPKVSTAVLRSPSDARTMRPVPLLTSFDCFEAFIGAVGQGLRLTEPLDRLDDAALLAQLGSGGGIAGLSRRRGRQLTLDPCRCRAHVKPVANPVTVLQAAFHLFRFLHAAAIAVESDADAALRGDPYGFLAWCRLRLHPPRTMLLGCDGARERLVNGIRAVDDEGEDDNEDRASMGDDHYQQKEMPEAAPTADHLRLPFRMPTWLERNHAGRYVPGLGEIRHDEDLTEPLPCTSLSRVRALYVVPPILSHRLVRGPAAAAASPLAPMVSHSDLRIGVDQATRLGWNVAFAAVEFNTETHSAATGRDAMGSPAASPPGSPRAAAAQSLASMKVEEACLSMMAEGRWTKREDTFFAVLNNAGHLGPPCQDHVQSAPRTSSIQSPSRSTATSLPAALPTGITDARPILATLLQHSARDSVALHLSTWRTATLCVPKTLRLRPLTPINLVGQIPIRPWDIEEGGGVAAARRLSNAVAAMRLSRVSGDGVEHDGGDSEGALPPGKELPPPAPPTPPMPTHVPEAPPPSPAARKATATVTRYRRRLQAIDLAFAVLELIRCPPEDVGARVSGVVGVGAVTKAVPAHAASPPHVIIRGSVAFPSPLLTDWNLTLKRLTPLDKGLHTAHQQTPWLLTQIRRDCWDRVTSDIA